MEVMEWIVVAAIPALGLIVLWFVLERWGRKHDPMKRSNFDHLTPGSAGRRRSSLDD